MAYTIRNNCVGCLKCTVECPKQAIVLSADIPVIDASRCISCGLCARICNEGAPVDLNAPAAAVAPHEPIELDCDVLVIGGGGSGLVAAARAAYKTGRKVIVLEKGAKTGGGAWYAADFKMFNSRWQKERGIPDVLETSLRKAMDDTYWVLDPQLARDTYTATGRFFDWVCDTTPGAEDEFREGFYIFDGPNGPKVPVFKKMRRGKQGGTGKYIMDRMLELCLESGVDVRTETEAVSFERDGARITAVRAKDAGGELRITCGSCILASGSWIENQDMLTQCDPKFAVMPKVRSPHRSPKYTGDGIRMADEAGLQLDPDSMCLRLMGPLFMPADDTDFTAISAMTFDPSQIWVNLDGKRWTSETFGGRCGNFFSRAIPLREQKEGISFTLFDANCIERARASQADAAVQSPFPMPPIPADWEAQLDEAVQAWPFAFFKADTIEELAEKTGLPAENLSETIRRYNELCETGEDTDFSKLPKELVPLCRAPYYALRCQMATDGAFGGIPINRDLKANSADGTPMENLYVTGDITSSRFINQGGVKIQIINDLAWAFASGFLAGESASL